MWGLNPLKRFFFCENVSSVLAEPRCYSPYSHSHPVPAHRKYRYWLVGRGEVFSLVDFFFFIIKKKKGGLLT